MPEPGQTSKKCAEGARGADSENPSAAFLICCSPLGHEFPHNFAGGGNERHADIEAVKRDRELFKINSAHVSVRAQKHPAIQQVRLRDNERIVLFFGWNQSAMPERIGDAFDNAMTDRDKIQRLKAPLSQAGQRAKSRLTFFFGVTTFDSEGQFMQNGRRHNKPDSGDSFPNGVEGILDRLDFQRQIKQDVGINGYEHEQPSCRPRRR